ncbi:hypothetical protein F4604DRAFT_1820318 [Suillus subluteus]|nr:hypothetical protein F4604DRAFT_1820318 [Suillus subluteus]
MVGSCLLWRKTWIRSLGIRSPILRSLQILWLFGLSRSRGFSVRVLFETYMDGSRPFSTLSAFDGTCESSPS